MRTIVILLAALIGLAANCQTIDSTQDAPPATKKEQRAARKALEQRLAAQRDSVAHILAARALKSGFWVLQATRASLGRATAQRTNLDERTNFVFQQDKDGAVQVALPGPRLGLNGLGGVTLTGRVTGARIKGSPDDEFYYIYHISGNGVSADVYLTVFKGTNKARATVTASFGPGEITLYGTVLPYNRNSD